MWVATANLPGLAAATPVELEAELSLAPVEVNVSNGLSVFVVQDASSADVAVCTTYRAGLGYRAEKDRAASSLVFDALSQLATSERSFSSKSLADRHGRETFRQDGVGAEFCTELPKSELSFAIWLEGNRLAGATLDQESVEAARTRRLKQLEVAENGANRGRARLRRLMFAGDPTLGLGLELSAVALKSVTFAEVQAFFAKHYAGSTAQLVVVGNASKEQVRALVMRHFPAKSPRATNRVDGSERYPQTSERYSTIIDSTSKTPTLLYGWAFPTTKERSHGAFLAQFIANMLCSAGAPAFGGERAGTRLGVERCEAVVHEEKGVASLELMLVGSPLLKVDLVHEEVASFLSRLASTGPTTSDLVSAKSAYRQKLATALGGNLERASFLSERLIRSTFASPSDLAKRAEEVTPDQVRAFSFQYLAPTKKTLVEIYPTKWYEPGPPLARYRFVKAGETLSAIARSERVTLEALLKANGLQKGKPIVVGQKLLLPKSTLPAPRLHVVRKGETLSGIAKRYGVSVAALRQANGISAKKPLRVGHQLLVPDAVR